MKRNSTIMHIIHNGLAVRNGETIRVVTKWAVNSKSRRVMRRYMLDGTCNWRVQK